MSHAIEPHAPATQTDQEAVREVLLHYVAALRAGSVQQLKQLFHPSAMMSGYLGPEMMVVPVQALYDLVDAAPPSAATDTPFREHLGAVHVVGHTATAELTELGYLGFNFVDRFHLLKDEDGSWQIVARMFTTF